MNPTVRHYLRGFVKPLLAAAGLGLLVPVALMFAVQWRFYGVFDHAAPWLWPSAMMLMATENSSHPWIIVVAGVLSNVVLYVSVAFLGVSLVFLGRLVGRRLREASLKKPTSTRGPSAGASGTP